MSEEKIKENQILILTNNKSLQEVEKWGQLCHQEGISFICSDAFGLWGYIFADFGNEYVIQDNGDEKIEGIIEYLIRVNENTFLVKLSNKDFNWNDLIEIEQVKGIEGMNGKIFKIIEIKSLGSYMIQCDQNLQGEYISGGICTRYKTPIKKSYSSISEIQSFTPEKLHQKVIEGDFLSYSENLNNIAIFQSILTFLQKNDGEFPRRHQEELIQDFLNISQEYHKKYQLNADLKHLRKIICQARGDLNCISSFLGGILAQEAIKAQTKKYYPLDQFLFYDSVRQCIPSELDLKEYEEEGTRYDGQIAVFGKTLQKKILNSKYLLVGAGAIGKKSFFFFFFLFFFSKLKK